jgi:hypothetical protein
MMPLLGAGVSLIGSIMGANAQNNAATASYNASLANLYEQRRQAMEREKLAKSARTDAYGNTVRYIPGRGFVTETTPIVQAILNAQQKEQLAGFREDAPRARRAAERIDARAIKAGDKFDEVFNAYENRREKSKEEYIAEAVRDASRVRNENRGSKDALGNLSRAALRTNNKAMLPFLLNASKGNKSSLVEVLANAKKAGTQQYYAEKGAENASTFGELGNLRSIADAFVSPSLDRSNQSGQLSQRQDNALNSLINANLASSNLLNSASGRVAQAAGRTGNFPDLSGFANALSKMQTNAPMSEKEKLLADLLLDQKIGTAQLGIAKNDQYLSAFRPNIGTF